jgi:chromosome segregation ATPase
MQQVLEILNDLKAGQVRLETGQGALEAGQAQLEVGQGSLDAGLVKLEAGQTRLGDRLTKLEDRQTRLEDRQARLEAGQTSLRVDLMDRLEDMNTKIRDDIAVNFGTADAVRRANDNTREELRALSDVVSVMHRQINRLQTEVEQLKGSA